MTDKEYEELNKIPYGKYFTFFYDLRFGTSKKSGKKMLTTIFMINEGTYDGGKLYINQIIETDWQIKKMHELLNKIYNGAFSLSSYKEKEDAIDAIRQKVASEGYEYCIDFYKNDKGYENYDIIGVYIDADDDEDFEEEIF